MTKPIFHALRLSLVSGAVLSSGLIPCAVFAQEPQPSGTSFVDNFDKIDSARWYISDGWNNGPHQNCTWSKKQIGVENGMLQLKFTQAKTGARDYACGEIQTTKTYGYGTYEARYRTATGSGLNSAFFTYIGPTDHCKSIGN